MKNTIESALGASGAFVRLIWIGVLTGALCIPLGLVSWTALDRSNHRDEAVQEMTNSWGASQKIIGPVLLLPFEKDTVDEEITFLNGQRNVKERKTTTRHIAVLLPDDLKVTGDVDAKSLYRGIYRAAVYSTELQFAGDFPVPDFEEMGIKPDRILWDEALVTVSVSDLRGTKGMLSLDLAGRSFPFLPGDALSISSGVKASLRGLGEWREPVSFTFKINMRGSDSLQFSPVGKVTTVELQSPWADPSFTGSFLPTERTIKPDGFHAKWDVSYYGRKYSQQFLMGSQNQPALQESLFGVNLVVLVDGYRCVLRALKYSVLFVGLAFMGFFIYEVLSASSVHTVQYLLVGLTLSLFFMLLLALSEFISFPAAYGMAAFLTVGMIFLYCRSVLGKLRDAFLMGTGLTAIHIFLFTILQLEDYSLLVGTLGLLGGLGLVMYLTRKVNWSNIGQPVPPPLPKE